MYTIKLGNSDSWVISVISLTGKRTDPEKLVLENTTF